MPGGGLIDRHPAFRAFCRQRGVAGEKSRLVFSFAIGR
jgi:hypothetical protein